MRIDRLLAPNGTRVASINVMTWPADGLDNALAASCAALHKDGVAVRKRPDGRSPLMLVKHLLADTVGYHPWDAPSFSCRQSSAAVQGFR